MRTSLPISRGRRHIVVDDLGNGKWRIWLHTADYKHGTSAVLHPDGRIVGHYEEGDEIQEWEIKPNVE